MANITNQKILYLITKSNYGGAQKQVFELAVEAKRRGYETVVAAGGTGAKEAAPGTLKNMLEKAEVAFRPIQNFMRDMSILRDIRAIFEVIHLVQKEKPDILHVTSSKAGGLGAFAGRLVGIKRIVFTSHGLTMDETWRPLWQRVLITWGTWLTMILAHHTIMISTETYERVKKLPLISSRVSLIFNGITPIALLSKAEARARLIPNIPAGDTLIGGIGELHPNKNWEALIKALPNLPQNVHVVIIGEGETRTQLESLSQELGVVNRVHLLGFVKDASTYVRLWDIFVLPSKKEGLPYVLLEAGFAKLPVVASNLPGNQDIVSHKVTGLLVEPDTDSITTALLHLLENEGLREKYGVALSNVIAEKFSIEKMLNQTFDTYSAIKQ